MQHRGGADRAHSRKNLEKANSRRGVDQRGSLKKANSSRRGTSGGGGGGRASGAAADGAKDVRAIFYDNS